MVFSLNVTAILQEHLLKRYPNVTHKNYFYLQNPVGPGRYDVDRYGKAQHANGHSSSFNSKTKRYDLIRDKYLT